jgi:hypothetical protein
MPPDGPLPVPVCPVAPGNGCIRGISPYDGIDARMLILITRLHSLHDFFAIFCYLLYISACKYNFLEQYSIKSIIFRLKFSYNNLKTPPYSGGVIC